MSKLLFAVTHDLYAQLYIKQHFNTIITYRPPHEIISNSRLTTEQSEDENSGLWGQSPALFTATIYNLRAV